MPEPVQPHDPNQTFHVVQLKDGIKRMVNNYHEAPEDHDGTCEIMDVKESF